MSDFERKHAAWIDGELPSGEVEAFLRELREREGGADDLGRQRALGREVRCALLRGSEISSPEFFNHGVLERIRAESSGSRGGRALGRWWWGMGDFARLAWAGAFSVAVAVVLTVVVGPGPDPAAPASRVLLAESRIDGVSATVLATDRSHYAVIWLDGLDYLPEEHRLQ